MVLQNQKDKHSKIRWHCRRGMLELDLLLHTYFDAHYAQLKQQDKDLFVQLLEYPDQELCQWLIGARDCPAPEFHPIIGQIKQEK